MAVIDNFRGILTVVVEFQTPDGKAQELAVKLKEFYEETVKGYDGLISVNYHTSLDLNSVFNYAQWKNEESFDNFLADENVKKALSILGDYKSKFTKTKVVFAS